MQRFGGIMEKKMEATIGGILGLYWGCIGIMEKKMAATIGGILGLYWGYMG